MTLSACGGGSAISPSTTRKQSTAATTTIPPTTAPSATRSPSSPTPVSAVLPMVTCPTTYGLSPASTPVLPSTTSESVPGDLVGELAVYTDLQGEMKLLGPIGWACSATIGADGSERIDVHPPGQTGSTSEPFHNSSVEAIMGNRTGGCEGCAVTQASPLFRAAASQCESQFAGDAQECHAQPTGESTESIEPGVVGFLDPPGVTGDGNPSGGQYPANGVMTFQTSRYTESFLDTCTLPASRQALCTAALDNFVQLYGTA